MVNAVGKACVGCGACEQRCPNNCITLCPDNEGFLYPQINMDICTGCDACERVCPAISAKPLKDRIKTIYGVKPSASFDAIKQSASAGVAFSIAEEAISDGGIAYGASYDKDHEVSHFKVSSLGDIWRIQNSKYVQSDVRGVYQDVEKYLKTHLNSTVCFTGTPCQCAGLKTYLGKEYVNLICVDLICHGVPSPLLFKKYLGYLEHRFGEKITEYHFRTKRYGWNHNGKMVEYAKVNTHYLTNASDPYLVNYLMANDYRECCYECKFNSNLKSSDITLGDFASCRALHKEFFDKAGCSVVVINTDKGIEFFERIRDKYDVIELSPDEVGNKFNRNLEKPCVRPKKRDSIYEGIEELSDIDFVNQNLMPSVSKKAIVSFYIPYSVKSVLKNIIRRLRKA